MSRSMLDKTMPIQDHVCDTRAISSRALVDVKTLVPNCIVIIGALENHFITFDPYVAITTSAVAYIKDRRTITVDLNGILSRIPGPAKYIILRRKFFLQTGSERKKRDDDVASFHGEEGLSFNKCNKNARSSHNVLEISCLKSCLAGYVHKNVPGCTSRHNIASIARILIRLGEGRVAVDFLLRDRC